MSNSLEDMEVLLKQRLIKAQEDAIQIMLLKLDEFITEKVYNENSPEQYKRTFQVFDMFDSIKSYVKGDTVYGAIGVAGTNGFKDVDLIHRKATWTHETQDESQDFYPPDAVDMVTIIEEGLNYNNSIFGEIQKRPFWSDFKKWCIDNYNDIFRDCCIRNNIPIK